MKCPGCGAQSGDVECTACGLVYAKLIKSFELKPTPPRNPWIARGIAIAVVVMWLLILWLTSRK
jgi:hypothetical protein